MESRNFVASGPTRERGSDIYIYICLGGTHLWDTWSSWGAAGCQVICEGAVRCHVDPLGDDVEHLVRDSGLCSPRIPSREQDYPRQVVATRIPRPQEGREQKARNRRGKEFDGGREGAPPLTDFIRLPCCRLYGAYVRVPALKILYH